MRKMATKVREITIKEFFISTDKAYAEYLSKHITSIQIEQPISAVVKQQYHTYKAHLSDGSYITCGKTIVREYCRYYEKDYNLTTNHILSDIIYNYYDFISLEYSKRQTQQR